MLWLGFAEATSPFCFFPPSLAVTSGRPGLCGLCGPRLSTSMTQIASIDDKDVVATLSPAIEGVLVSELGGGDDVDSGAAFGRTREEQKQLLTKLRELADSIATVLVSPVRQLTTTSADKLRPTAGTRFASSPPPLPFPCHSYC